MRRFSVDWIEHASLSSNPARCVVLRGDHRMSAVPMNFLRTLRPPQMQPAAPDKREPAVQRNLAAQLGHWFASSLDLRNGLDVIEVMDTLPTELWEQLTGAAR